MRLPRTQKAGYARAAGPFTEFSMIRRAFLFTLLASALPICAPAQAPQPGKTVRLLNIGNSFSGNATRFLKDLAQASGHTLIHRAASIGGSSMQVHWDKAQLHEKRPTDPAGLYLSKLGLREELQKEPWDYVTIQQASIKSHDLATYEPYATHLRDYVKQHAPQATLLLHQTWAYRVDDPRFSAREPKPGDPKSQEEMYRMLSHAYRTTAARLNVALIPTGDAMRLADIDPKWGFVPDRSVDPKTFAYPTLPPQPNSVHMGFTWRKQKDGTMKLIMDGHHANTAGEYLGSCVFYEVLFQDSVVGNAFVPANLDPAFARFLQEAAHRAVTENRAQRSE